MAPYLVTVGEFALLNSGNDEPQSSVGLGHASAQRGEHICHSNNESATYHAMHMSYRWCDLCDGGDIRIREDVFAKYLNLTQDAVAVSHP